MPEAPPSSRSEFPRAVLAVAATYGYFLLFAEFSFLHQVRALLGDGSSLRLVMGALGAGGIAGSIVGWLGFRAERLKVRLSTSYFACAVMAAVAPQVSGLWPLALVAAGIGLALGWNTVTLASGLRFLLPPARLGWGIGLGTGSAYALCNIPVVFTASPAVQAATSAGLAALAGLATAGKATRRDAPPVPERVRVWPWVGVFLALVWLDSAAFDIIQQTPALRSTTWSGSTRLWANAVIHFGAAVAAGWLLDRGWQRSVVGTAWGALAAACLALGAATAESVTGFLYAGGVSLYSTALVFCAARTGRPWAAAAMFAVAGWVGSALGIGMAQDLRHVPPAFVLASGLLLAGTLRPWSRAALLLVAGLALVRPARAEADESLIAAGREVYIAEGCMHCHSQYVRPGVEADVVRWGPVRPLEDILHDGPPLPGNRRQGPDLANVGNRRSPDWNRLHLQAPRSVSPGSRMPSYAHLFAPGDGRGEALVAYLSSLGAATVADHWETMQGWRPAPTVAPIAPAEAARLFTQNCAQCHGPDGRGDGPLAAQLRPPPPDWTRDAWRRVPNGDEIDLARLIKFGTLGTAMAGHEAYTDGEILGLARHVKLLHK
jgi:mono/diheme cytochrome c family protein